MNVFVVAVIILGFATAGSSFWVIRHVAHKPANGERGTLDRMQKKLEALQIKSVDM